MKSESYSLMNLEKLNIQEEMNYSCDTMLHIYPTANTDYSVLTDREKSILGAAKEDKRILIISNCSE